jgi:hypothetical protein
MVNIIFCLAVFVLITNNFPQSSHGSGVLLYSQTDLVSNQTSLPSYKNTTSVWEQVADDFTVTSGWTIDQIVVMGDDIDTNYVAGFNIYIYTNNNGTPGTLIYSAETQPYSILFLYYFIWQVIITLETPAIILPGDYFISVQFHFIDPGSASWYWTQVNGSFGGTAMFRNYSAYCTAWAPLYHCLPTSYTDMYFELYGFSVVPVELASFSVNVNDDNVESNWTTATETNNKGFEVQRSKDGEFESIGFVEGHGTTTETQVYSFIDKNVVKGKYHYRLKQIDHDGTFEYSNVVKVEVLSPSKFSLEQNYPNPFNPSTKIKYTIPNVETHRDASLQIVTLKVFDVLGNEVATLVNEEKSAGTYEVEFNSRSGEVRNLTSGIYFYKLQTGSLVETKKMILMK